MRHVGVGRTTAELMQIANAGGGMELVPTGRTTAELMQIANSGRGHVIFAPAPEDR